MRPRTAGFALALSVSLVVVAHAGPQRGQGSDDPSVVNGPTKPVAVAPTPSWTLLGSNSRPSPRMSTYAVIDPVHDRMVVFGGWGFGYFSDTWLLDLATGTWTSVDADSTHPGPRMEYASILDPVRNRMIVFGGKDPYTNEVWALDLSGTPSWSLLATAGTPPSPRESRAIYDPVRDRMVVFGGYSPTASPNHLNETWELTLSGTPTWNKLTTSGGVPAPRRGQSVIYDSVQDRMIVFGGYDDVTFMNDVWSLDLGTLVWRQIAAFGGAPSGRYGQSATFDPVRRQMFVFGGYNAYSGFLNDLYVLSLDTSPTWTQVTGALAPTARDFHSAAYDAARQRIVLFAGNSGPVFNDLWALDTGTRTWASLDLNSMPPPRLGSYAITDVNSQRMVLFGGWGNEYFDDTWTLALDQTPPRWTFYPSAAHPSARLEHATAYDGSRDRMLLFGGKDATRFFNDVWQLDLSGDPSWLPITTAGTPPSPRECRAIYDPVRDRLLLFGGFSYPNHLNELWELSLSGTPTWRQLDPNGQLPPPRRGQDMIYDPANDEVLVFGGYDDHTFFNDVWSLSFNGGHEHWNQLHPTGVGPGPRYGASATLDPVRRQMLVFGGYDGHYLDDAFALALDGPQRWTSLDTPEHPGPTDFHTMAYDPGSDRFLLFGGNNGQPLGDLWQLGFGNPVLLPPPVSLVAGQPKLAVSGVSLAPGSRIPLLQLTVPTASVVRLEMFDVAGRRLADRSFTPAAIGRNAIPLAEARALRAGIYLVRVTQNGTSAVGRALVVP